MNYAKMFAEAQARVIERNTSKESSKIKSKINELETTNLWTIKWVWDITVKKLLEKWISSKEELLGLWEEWIGDLKLNPFSLKSIKEFLKK